MWVALLCGPRDDRGTALQPTLRRHLVSRHHPLRPTLRLPPLRRPGHTVALQQDTQLRLPNTNLRRHPREGTHHWHPQRQPKTEVQLLTHRFGITQIRNTTFYKNNLQSPETKGIFPGESVHVDYSILKIIQKSQMIHIDQLAKEIKFISIL